MIVTFMIPSSPYPIGAVMTLFEFANGLRRRGHTVHVVHSPVFGQRIGSLDELSWASFEPGIEHHLCGDLGPWDVSRPEEFDRHLPDADIIVGVRHRPEAGLPVQIIQGIDMVDPVMERSSYLTPGLKLCIAKWLVRVGERFGVPADELSYLPQGFDHERFRLVTPLDQRPPQVAMLYSAHPVKGWDIGLPILEEVHRRVPEMRAVVFGTATPPEVLPDWLTFHLEPTPEVLVHDIYNQSQVFVQPSRHEGFGFTAVESMATGCALVSTDNGGSEDYALDDVTALLAPPQDAALLTEHVVRLLADESLRTRLATAGRELVSRFDWDASAEIMESYFERYLADPTTYLRVPDPAADPVVDHG